MLGDSITPPLTLASLPNEVLTIIMTYAMANDVPVYFWLYLENSRDGKAREAATEGFFVKWHI